MKAILDAGPLIALWGRMEKGEDKYQKWASDIFNRYSGPFFTSEAVLCEVGFMTGRNDDILTAIEKKHFIVATSFERDFAAMSRVLNGFIHCDLADSSVVVLSEKLPLLDVLTIDRRHFLTYRRADKSALPLVLPD
ncbi:MAG: hypothetical protein M3Y82_01875 [Verrucomicrobiota bacterium]|nr:hypothetical protein [Verrucomicrobiota bacterium]